MTHIREEEEECQDTFNFGMFVSTVGTAALRNCFPALKFILIFYAFVNMLILQL